MKNERFDKMVKVLVIDDILENIECAKITFDRFDKYVEDRFLIEKQKLERYIKDGSKYHVELYEKEKNVFKNLKPKFNTTCVTDGKSALEEIKKENYDLVLSDVFFHYEDGKTPKEHIQKLQNILKDYRLNENEMLEPAKAWIEEGEAPPFGMLILNEVKKINPSTFIQFCTDLYHHNKLVEPVNAMVLDKLGYKHLDDYAYHFKSCFQRGGMEYLKEYFNDPNITINETQGKYWMKALYDVCLKMSNLED